MKYLKLFESFEDIDKICRKYSIENYTINPDGTIDVNGNVDLYNLGLTKLPIRFNKVNGWFACNYNKLTSLEGSPIEVNGSFYCSNNELTTLEGSPVEVSVFFDCRNNNLTTLEGSPKKIGGFFDCSFNNLITLEGSPKELDYDFKCHNNELTSFEFAPKIIRGNFDCENNNIKTFEYFPSFVKDYFYCYNNPIYQVWKLFRDTSKIELLNDFDIFRDEDTDESKIFIDRLNDFLEMIGKPTVEKVDRYKNI